jgi:hypothetical protein
LHDGAVDIRVHRSGMNVPSGKGKTSAGGELLSVGGAMVAPEHDVCSHHIAGESRHFCEFLPNELSQGRAQTKVMRGDMDGEWFGIHAVHGFLGVKGRILAGAGRVEYIERKGVTDCVSGRLEDA